MNKKFFMVILMIIVFISICIPKSFGATITPDQITGSKDTSDVDLDLDFIDDITDLLRTAGIFLAVGVMMVLGIKYMSGSLEEKAQYKKTMIPYLIGCFLIFSASVIAPQIIEIFKDAKDTQTVGNIALGLIRAIGTVVAVGVLMLLGIKYIIGSAEEKAEYKRSMLPYIIGSVMLFGAVNLTSILYNMIEIGGDSAAREFAGNHNYSELQEEYNRANEILTELQKSRRKR